MMSTRRTFLGGLIAFPLASVLPAVAKTTHPVLGVVEKTVLGDFTIEVWLSKPRLEILDVRYYVQPYAIPLRPPANQDIVALPLTDEESRQGYSWTIVAKS